MTIIQQSIEFAFLKHDGQYRKGSRVPYISHPLRVMGLVMEYTADDETIIAAVLHDVVEDAGGLLVAEEIRERFGKNVCRYVLECSDSTTPPNTPKPEWRERKENFINRIATITKQSRLIITCDKIDNMQSMLRDKERQGKDFWQNFKGGYDGTIWYLKSVLEQLKKTNDYPSAYQGYESTLEHLINQNNIYTEHG
jgi:GTP pyrophosphokinase